MSEELGPSENIQQQAVPMDLKEFEEAIKRDQEVLGMLYTGSLGRGTTDRFSDLDIEIWVTDAVFLESERKKREVLGYLGTVHFSYRKGTGCTAFVGDDWLPVDLWMHQMSDVDLPSEYAHARIVKDTDHFLAHLLEGIREKAVVVSWEEARSSIEEAIDSLVYLSLHNARGAIWSAMEEVVDRTTELYVLLAALRGLRSYGYRYVEQLLSPEELALLSATWPSSPSRQEVRRAARALWDWTRFVWQEAEGCLGRSLEIHLDEAGLLDAVERIYRR